MTQPTAGFVGLGTMGSALSAHLLAAGWRVTGCDIDPARLAAHTGRGGEAATGNMTDAFHAVADSTITWLAVTHDGGSSWKAGELPIRAAMARPTRPL